MTGIRGHRKGEPAVTERARVVVGADGHHSLVARRVNAEQYNEKPPLQVSYYTYVSGLPMDGRFEVHLRPDRGFAAWPTNDDLTVVIGGWPRSELAANRKDIEGNFLATLELVPDFAARFRAAKRETRFVGQSLAGFMRKPFGAGWALVGDAGYTKDFITGPGDQRRLPGRRAVRHRPGRSALGQSSVRGRHGRLPDRAGPALASVL